LQITVGDINNSTLVQYPYLSDLACKDFARTTLAYIPETQMLCASVFFLGILGRSQSGNHPKDDVEIVTIAPKKT
jgi:hypothetical protein